jgi:pimeloyl-ACP methyl ester carboxylesterase
MLQGRGFDLLAIEHRAAGPGVTLFIEGDGRPWQIGGRHVSSDPTPGSPLLLPQMLAWPGTALYLGRPCYFGLGPEQRCKPELWSFARYSPEVVGAMREAADAWLEGLPDIDELTLVGHSGGGVLALLMAEALTAVKHIRVVALSTPVSLERWTELHGYQPLGGSVDPASLERWRQGIERHFYFGALDRNVPAERFMPAIEAIPDSTITVVEGEGHLCCEPEVWRSRQQ